MEIRFGKAACALTLYGILLGFALSVAETNPNENAIANSADSPKNAARINPADSKKAVEENPAEPSERTIVSPANPANSSIKAVEENPAEIGTAENAQTAPAPGSEGDTLNRVDARMAYLVYKLLDKDGNIIGADVNRGAKLFYQNCRPCHGEDGKRINFNPGGNPEFIGIRARLDLPTFWYQMNFGDEERNMEAYIDEIELDEMRDIAAFAKTLP